MRLGHRFFIGRSHQRQYTTTRHCKQQAGFTLIELLLYVAVAGGLLASIAYFFAMTVDSRIKNQTINEVDQQGTQLMEYMTQTIRNATSITTPTAGTNGSSLTLAVPTGALSPTVFDITGGSSTVLGFNADGGSDDTGDNNSIDATKFTATATGTISTLYARVGATLSASPNNKAQMAIYSGAASPTTLLASSGDAVLTASSWNAFSIPAVSVTSGQTYWLAYNSNGLAANTNTLRYQTGSAGQERFFGQTYGTWPGSWTGTTGSLQLSLYGNIVSGGSSGIAEVKEGAGTAVPLIGSQLQLNSLTFTNLTRSGTNGVVQVSFTLSRLNPQGRNEYDYQRTFTSSAEVGW